MMNIAIKAKDLKKIKIQREKDLIQAQYGTFINKDDI